MPHRFILKGGDVYIGDPGDREIRPRIRLERWRGECHLKLIFDDSKIRQKRVRYEAGRLKWETETFDFHFYPIDPNTFKIEHPRKGKITFLQNELGGLEFEIILKTKPKTNRFVFNIETKGLKFYYQPPLHPDHPTWADMDRDGVADCFRPPNVVGSYAVYHAEKRNLHSSREDGEKYRVGKAFHIYRPKAIDAKGREVWCDLHIDEKRGVLAITIPQRFLDEASYPVKIDPTFGYETKGASYTYLYQDIAGSWFTCPENGTAESITAYHDDWGAGNEYAIYKKSDNSLVGHTESGTGQQSAGWHTFNFSDPKPSLSANTDYWLVLWGTANTYYYYDSGDSGKGGRQDDVDKWPDPWTVSYTHLTLPTTERV